MLYGNIDPKLLTISLVISIWELIWKGFALWKAARNDSKIWYLALLFLNTAGVLPIIYLVIEYVKQKKSVQA